MSVIINKRHINENELPYFVAEVSGNHKQSLSLAKETIQAAAEAGADAVKFQTYTPDTLTLNVRNKYFKKNGGLWDGRYLYDLYQEGMTPWDWFPELNAYAKKCGLTFFSTPFDETAVDFLEKSINPPAYKIASYEINHEPLLRKIAQQCKPVILSTGMAMEVEIKAALRNLKKNGATEIILLKCISGYPAVPEGFNLRTIPSMYKKFKCPIGLSDHTMGHEVALGAVALGACFIEKHFILDRTAGGIDSDFSLEPHEFAEMTQMVTTLYKSLGTQDIGPSQQEAGELCQRRSIFVAQPIRAGEIFTKENIKIVRPGHGLCPSQWRKILGKKARKALDPGEPVSTGDWV